MRCTSCPRCEYVNGPRSQHCSSCGTPLDERNTGPKKYYDVPAGFWIRLAAWLVDSVVLAAAQSALIAVGPGFDVYESELHWVHLVVPLGIASYFTVAVAVWQTTIGKRLFRLYVQRTNGSRIGPGRALGRYLATILSALPFGIGYLMIGLRSDKRGLHDLICDTRVVKRKKWPGYE